MENIQKSSLSPNKFHNLSINKLSPSKKGRDFTADFKVQVISNINLSLTQKSLAENPQV